MSINQWHKHDKTNQEMNDLSGDRWWRWTMSLVWLTARVSFLVEMKEMRSQIKMRENEWIKKYFMLTLILGLTISLYEVG
jgi:hypothetical protein